MSEQDDEKWFAALTGEADDMEDTNVREGKAVREALNEQINAYKNEFKPDQAKVEQFLFQLRQHDTLAKSGGTGSGSTKDMETEIIAEGFRAAASHEEKTEGVETYATEDKQFTFIVQPTIEVATTAMISLRVDPATASRYEGRTLLVRNSAGVIVLEGVVSNGEIIGTVSDYTSFDLGQHWRVELRKE